jgi:hypothetical protein
MKGKRIAFLLLALAASFPAGAADDLSRGRQEIPSYRVMLAQRAEPLLALLLAADTGGGLSGERLAMRPNPDPFLSLPPERAAKLHALQDEMKRMYGQLEERLAKLRAGLDEVYGSYRLDERRRRSLYAAIGETQNQLLDLHYNFQLKLRAILTEAEFETLQQRLREARERKLAILKQQLQEDEKKKLEALEKADPEAKKRGDR